MRFFLTMPYNKKEKKTIRRYLKEQRFEIFTGLEADKQFINKLIFHWLFLKDISDEQMIKMIEARTKIIHSLFTFQDLTKKIPIVKYD